MWSQHFEVFKNFFHHWVVKCLAFFVMAKIQMDSTKQYIADYNRTRRQPWHVFGRIVIPGYEWGREGVSNLAVSVSWGLWLLKWFFMITLGLWGASQVIVLLHPVRQYCQAEGAQQKQDSLQMEREKERKRMQSLEALDVMEARNKEEKRKLVLRSIHNNIEQLDRDIDQAGHEATDNRDSAMEEMRKPNAVLEGAVGVFGTVVTSTLDTVLNGARRHTKRFQLTGSSRTRRVDGLAGKPKPVVRKLCTRLKSGKCKATDAPQFTGKKRMCDDCHKHEENNPASKRQKKVP